jgi:hypothetical protein
MKKTMIVSVIVCSYFFLIRISLPFITLITIDLSDVVYLLILYKNSGAKSAPFDHSIVNEFNLKDLK